MRLTFLSNEFPNAWEPNKATFNFDLLRALARQHEVTVVSPISWVDELRARWQGRGSHRTWSGVGAELDVRHPRFWYPPGRMRQHYGSFLWQSLRGTVRDLERRPLPDCVLSYWAHPDGECAVRMARRWGVPSLVMVGGSDVLLMTREPARRAKIAAVLRQADGVIAMSHDLKQKIVELGASSQRVHVLRRGVDETFFSRGDQLAARRELGLSPDRKMMLWVGRMVPVKGLETLIEACRLLRDAGANFQVQLVGDGPLREELTRRVAAERLSEFITFAGGVPHDRLGPWFRAADFTVLPSRSEGIPNVLLESLACGTPWVASRVGGIPEIAAGSATRLVAPDSPVEWAAALSDFLQTTPTVPAAASPDTLTAFAERVASLAQELARESGSKRPYPRLAQLVA